MHVVALLHRMHVRGQRKSEISGRNEVSGCSEHATQSAELVPARAMHHARTLLAHIGARARARTLMAAYPRYPYTLQPAARACMFMLREEDVCSERLARIVVAG